MHWSGQQKTKQNWVVGGLNRFYVEKQKQKPSP